MYPNVFNKNSHSVSVTELKNVVSITEHEVTTPLCPMFFAITKQLPVVALPSITNIEISFSPVNSSFIDIGRKIAQNNISFINVIKMLIENFDLASLILNDAPREISERGLAMFPRYEIDFDIITG